MTLPNLILACLPFMPPEAFRSGEDVPDVETVLPDLEQGGELAVTPEVKGAFRALLRDRCVDLRFSWGGWADFASKVDQGMSASS